MRFPVKAAILALASVSLVLSGCNAGQQLSRLNPFSGSDREDPNAPPRDQRVPVLALGEQLAAVEDGLVTLPPAYVNDRWPQPDGFPTHAMQHTQARGSLQRLWRVDAGAGSNRDRRINARPVVLDGVVYTVDALLMTIIGGVGTFIGPVIGAGSLHIADVLFRDANTTILGFNIGQNWLLITGFIFVIVVLVFPYGMVGTWRRAQNWLTQRLRNRPQTVAMTRTGEPVEESSG